VLGLRTCTPADVPHLVQALNECLYKGYRFHVVMTEERFLHDRFLHDVDLDLTFLIHDDGVPRGVALVARRGARAWIAGMGVHPELRGRGIGAEMLQRVKERAALAGVEEILLEVLKDNNPARRCYLKAGFVPRRRFFCYRGTPRQAGRRGVVQIRPVTAEYVLASYRELHGASPCWQRDFRTLNRRGEELKGIEASSRGEASATLLYSKSAIADVGTWPGGPPLGVSFPDLLHHAFGSDTPFAIVNVPDDDPLHGIMQAVGYEVYAEQLDMRCELRPSGSVAQGTPL